MSGNVKIVDYDEEKNKIIFECNNTRYEVCIENTGNPETGEYFEGSNLCKQLILEQTKADEKLEKSEMATYNPEME